MEMKPIEVDKRLKKCRNLVNKIVNNLNRTDLDWTVQVSTSSINPDKVKWCAQIEAPANGLQPLTWVKDSADELETALKASVKGLNQEEVEKAYIRSQIEQCVAKQMFFEEKLEELENTDEIEYNEGMNNKEVSNGDE